MTGLASGNPSAQALLRVEQMRIADRLAIAGGLSGEALMHNAGMAVAAAAGRLVHPPARIAVICGPGNNGGDGFVAAAALAATGFAVSLGLAGPREDLAGDAARAAAAWAGPVVRADEIELAGYSLIIDALFGAGLSRDLDGDVYRLVQRLNASGVKVLAVDLPSGIDGDSGQIRGIAVRAAATVTFYRMKPGHRLMPGRHYCGYMEVADIGMGADVMARIGPDVFSNAPALWQHRLPQPAEDGHKYDRGHALVFSGGEEGIGASHLAARAALRAGSGLVTIAAPAAAFAGHAARGPDALMLRRADGLEACRNLLEDARRNAVLIGPAFGLGAATRAMVGLVVASGRACVLDADALTACADDPASLFAAIHQSRCAVVLTPHEGEFARLFPSLARLPSKLARAGGAALASGAIVILKGPDTVIAEPGGRAAISDNATADLATAGSGDVLGGIVAGLLAQGMPGFEAACAAVWLHGEAGRIAGPGLIADDLPEALRGPLGGLRAADGG